MPTDPMGPIPVGDTPLFIRVAGRSHLQSTPAVRRRRYPSMLVGRTEQSGVRARGGASGLGGPGRAVAYLLNSRRNIVSRDCYVIASKK